MKIMIKRLSAILLLTATLVLLCSCYIVSSAKMKNVQGTYELTTYSTSKNVKEERGITLYIVVKSDGSGYYAYSDNDTELYYSDLKCRFTQDSEKSGYYSYVEVDFNGSGNWFSLGVNSNSKTLGSNVPKYKGNIFDGSFGLDYYTTVTFTRVDKATDMSYIEEVLGEISYISNEEVKNRQSES